MELDHRQQFWQQHIAAWTGSGLTQRAYAEAHGISVKGMSYWVRKLSPKKPAAGVAFIPAHVQGTETALMLSGPGGWVLHLPDTVPAAWVASLLKTLA